MKLVIAEKPSLARNICNALHTVGESFRQEDGGEYSASQNYYVTSVFGHIFELKDIDKYDVNSGRDMWKSNNLPFFPNKYEWVLSDDSGINKRFKTIKSLCDRDDVDEIIHCGDSDREGQLIVDKVLDECGTGKYVSRPWLNEMTEDGIIKAFNDRRPNDRFFNIKMEGLARTYIDYDFGKNLSRYATDRTKAYPALNVGRVKGAIVNVIYEREVEIDNFVPRKYYKVESDVEGSVKLISEKEFSEEELAAAESWATVLNGCKAVVTKLEQKEVVKQSPKLFSQTSLQAFLNKRYGTSPDETLKLAQSLYEKQLTTYPRTNTEYLMPGEGDTVKKLIEVHGGDELIYKDTKRVFDADKIEGHSAIIPTIKTPSGLTEKEQQCYDAILNRFKAVFCEKKCVVKITEGRVQVGDEEMKIRGEVLVAAGWKKFEPDAKDGENKERILPDLAIGNEVETDFSAVEKETKPPKRWTVETLGKWMENPFRKESAETDDDDYAAILSGAQIGTEATRASTIKTLIDKEYIALKKSTYSLGPRGGFLINACNQLGISMTKEKTAELGQMTKAVAHGDKRVDDVLDVVRKEIASIIAAGRDVQQDPQAAKMHDPIGKCPKCGADYLPGKYGAYCSGHCGFSLKYFRGKAITDAQVKSLLQGKKVLFKGLVSKTGKKYDVYAIPTKEVESYTGKDGKTYYSMKFDTEFPQRK